MEFRRLVRIGLLACLLLTAACGREQARPAGSGPTSASAAYVAVPGRALAAPTGGVTESDGSTWRYRDAERGRLTLLYFGYTSCPDVCPTTLADLARALEKLPRSTSAKVAVQFVSTDPHRDTAGQIRTWLGGFDPSFRGGRAPIGRVATAACAYGITITPPKVSGGDYQVTHGAQLLVLEPGGGAVGYFRELAGWRAYARTLPGLVRRYA